MKTTIPGWHSLMYLSGILMLVLGTPAIVVSGILLWLKGSLDQKQSIYFVVVMLAVVVPLAAILWLSAIFITKRRAKANVQ